jgi:hypothetical protein
MNIMKQTDRAWKTLLINKFLALSTMFTIPFCTKSSKTSLKRNKNYRLSKSKSSSLSEQTVC